MVDIPQYLKNSEAFYVCVIDGEGRYSYVNSLFKKNYAFLSEEFVGYSALDSVLPEDHPRLGEATAYLMAHPEETIKLNLKKPTAEGNGFYHTTLWEMSLLRNSSGEFQGYLCVGYEYTVSDNQLNLLKQFPESFFIVDQSGRIVKHSLLPDHPFYSNDVKPDGMQIDGFFLPESVEQAKLCLGKILAGEEPQILEHTIHKNGTQLYFQASFSPISYNRELHVLIVERNITAERANEDILKKSIERSKAIWESITDMFHFINKDWQIEYANSAWERYFGFTSPSEYLGKTIWELFPAMEGEPIERCFRKAMATKEVCNFEGYYESGAKWFSMRVFPSSRGISVYNRDITDIKQLELKEQQLETRLKDVWEKLIDGYVSLNSNLEVVYANQAFTKLFNLKEAAVTGLEIKTLLNEDTGQHSEFQQTLNLVLQSGEVQRKICYFEGKEIWINAAFFPTAQGVDIYMQDISHAERLRNTMNDLSFMTSHELRHEYAKLHSVVNLMSVSGDDDKYLLKEAHKSLIQINSLISLMNDKLTFNRDNSLKGNNDDYVEFDEVVLIDDDHVINFINARVIRLLFENIKVKSFSHAEKALDYLRENDKEGKKLIFIDLNMPGFDGWDFLDIYRELPVRSKVYILTSSINPRDIERSMEYKEVLKFLTKPLSVELLEYERIRPLVGKLS